MAKTKYDVYRRIDEWQKENVKRVVIKLNKRTDADILEVLSKQESVQGYIKDAIRQRIRADNLIIK